MAFTNHLGRTKLNFKTKILLPIFQENPPHNIKILKTTFLLLLLNRQSRPEVKKFKCLGFRHIVANCPNKRTILVKGGNNSK